MCGRYVVAYDPATLVQGFSLTRVQPFPRRWNIAPQSEVPVVHDTREGERVGTLMRWGLVPVWAKDPSVGARMNNARLETAAEKPSFRQALRRRRCLIPASGFYEWQPRTGADGVMIASCRHGGCEYRLGERWTIERLTRQREPQLRGKVPAERIAAVFVSANDGKALADAASEFRFRLRALPATGTKLQPYIRRTAHHA